MSQPQQAAAPSPYRDYRSSQSPGAGASFSFTRSPRTLVDPQYAVDQSNRTSLNSTQTGQSPVALMRAHGISPVTPVMAQAYNPQQWTQSQMGFQRVMPVASSTREVTGMEASMPSPPPPYTPTEAVETFPRVRPSPMLDQMSFTASPITTEASSSNVILPTISTAFPPPPNSQGRNRERSASGQRILNTFQSFTGRGKQPVSNETMALLGMQVPQQMEDVRPPAARRAASAGQVSTHSYSPPVRLTQRQDSMQSGVALPGPPPGPPPTGSRSQSLNRYATTQTIEAPQPVRRTALASTLGPVPPTPADWNDGDNMPEAQTGSTQPYQPLRIDTGGVREHSLSRRPATRDTSAQGLRERRSRSKAAREGSYDEEPASAIDREPTMTLTRSGTISQRREHARKISVVAAQDSPGIHVPASVMTPPYTPAVARQQAPDSAVSEHAASKLPPNIDAFYKQSLERHRIFLEKEAAAATDEERLEAFANYMVHESRLRRDKYQAAYNTMAGEIVDLTRDMWRSYSSISRRVATPRTANSHGPSSTTSDSFPPDSARPESSNSAYTPVADLGEEDLNTAARREGFKPCLSPIPSMAVSVQDDDSRGRAPSRWWEKSEASGSIGKPERIEKSHRETKYMGINPALLRSSPQPSPEVSRLTPTPGGSRFPFADEYPAEKIGWHEGHDLDTPMATPGHRRATPPNQMDLSRLVTLPPPYPRHHPAVNNNHPSLAGLRNEHRQLAENEETQRIKDAYIDQEWALRKSHADDAKKRRAKMRQSMQNKLNDGEISFADAAQAESKFEEDEVEKSKSNARALFDAFEASISLPLSTLITTKLATADKCMADLQTDLAKHNQNSDPNRAQEEGDEHPERLEKLTLLRWIFDIREVLHKEMFDLHAQRAEKYGEVVLTPYRIAKQQNKIDEAEAFFLKDGRQRAIAFHKQNLKRCEQFLAEIETNVNKGVEDQLSAFWDIAPGIREVVHHIPGVIAGGGEDDLRQLERFQFFIPPQEIAENPAYRKYPLQYLYSVLSHAEKSTYQFIESQTNLWCLLHAVRELTAEASLKVIELETSSSNADEELAREMLQAKSAEEKRMTADLKEKVGEVERQWKEALGDQLEEVKSGVRHWLEETGGWEDGLDD